LADYQLGKVILEFSLQNVEYFEVKNCGNEEIDEGKVIQIDLIEL
jgi:hypothetical protein